MMFLIVPEPAASGERPSAAGVSDDDPNSDAALMARIAADDAVAFAQFVRRHEASVRGFLQYLMGPAAATSGVQQVFDDCWRTRSRYQNDGSPRAALFRLARRRLQQHLRWHRLRRLTGRSVQHAPSNVEGRGATANRVVAEDDAPSQHPLFARALTDLSPREQQLVLLRLVLVLSYREISTILGESEATLCQRSHRLLLKLSEHMERRA